MANRILITAIGLIISINLLSQVTIGEPSYPTFEEKEIILKYKKKTHGLKGKSTPSLEIEWGRGPDEVTILNKTENVFPSAKKNKSFIQKYHRYIAEEELTTGKISFSCEYYIANYQTGYSSEPQFLISRTTLHINIESKELSGEQEDQIKYRTFGKYSDDSNASQSDWPLMEFIEENYRNKSKSKLDKLKEEYWRTGYEKYMGKDLMGAFIDYSKILEINKTPYYNGLIDSMFYKNCGVIAREIADNYMKKNDKMQGEKWYRHTIYIYNILAEAGFGGTSIYLQMTRDFYAIDDKRGAIQNLKKGLDRYPDSRLLFTMAAQAFYLSHDNESGLEFVEYRIREKPDCPAAYYWKGLLITNSDDLEEEAIEEALALYEKSLELDPTNVEVRYQCGYVYYSLGAHYFQKEAYDEDTDSRKELALKGKNNYNRAALKLEMTYEFAVDDLKIQKESLDILKRIYYKLYGSQDYRYTSVEQRSRKL